MLAQIVMMAVCAAEPGVSPAAACEHYEAAARLVQLHVYDAEGGSREGVAEGIRELQAAVMPGGSGQFSRQGEGSNPRAPGLSRLKMESGWRNPERNEAVLGGAV